MSNNISRRQFLLKSAITGGTLIATNIFSKSGFAQAPGIIIPQKMRPQIPYGAAIGNININWN